MKQPNKKLPVQKVKCLEFVKEYIARFGQFFAAAFGGIYTRKELYWQERELITIASLHIPR